MFAGRAVPPDAHPFHPKSLDRGVRAEMFAESCATAFLDLSAYEIPQTNLYIFMFFYSSSEYSFDN